MVVFSEDKGNFVRLNMKRRFYKRKGHGMSGARIKRQIWKSKLKRKLEGGSSYGRCFVCDEEGHWANKCPRRASRMDSEPVGDEVEETNYDTTDQIRSSECKFSQEFQLPDILPVAPDCDECNPPIAVPPLYEVAESGHLPGNTVYLFL